MTFFRVEERKRKKMKSKLKKSGKRLRKNENS